MGWWGNQTGQGEEIQLCLQVVSLSRSVLSQETSQYIEYMAYLLTHSLIRLMRSLIT